MLSRGVLLNECVELRDTAITVPRIALRLFSVAIMSLHRIRAASPVPGRKRGEVRFAFDAAVARFVGIVDHGSMNTAIRTSDG